MSFQAAAQNPSIDSVKFVQIVQKQVPQIAWPQPASIVYGTPLSSAQLNATASVAGVFNYTPAAPGILHAGSHSLSVSFVPSDSRDFAEADATVSLTVDKAVAKVTLSNLQQAYTGNPTTPSVTTLPAGLALVITYNGSITAPTAAGIYTVNAVINDPDYTGSTTGTLIIGAGVPSVSLTTATPAMLLGSPVLLQVQMASASAVPQGLVAIMDGATTLAMLTLSGGKASLTTSALVAGSHSLTAAYQGYAQFGPASSTPVAVVIFDYTVSIPGSGSASVVTGGGVQFPVDVTPGAGGSLPLASSLTVSGLPPLATVTVSPSQWVAQGSNIWQLGANVPITSPIVTVTTNEGVAKAHPVSPRPAVLPPAVCGLVLLVFTAGLGKRRRGWAWRLLTCTLCATMIFGLSGCGLFYEFYQPPPKTYTINVTITCGTLSHSTALTLTVE